MRAFCGHGDGLLVLVLVVLPLVLRGASPVACGIAEFICGLGSRARFCCLGCTTEYKRRSVATCYPHRLTAGGFTSTAFSRASGAKSCKHPTRCNSSRVRLRLQHRKRRPPHHRLPPESCSRVLTGPPLGSISPIGCGRGCCPRVVRRRPWARLIRLPPAKECSMPRRSTTPEVRGKGSMSHVLVQAVLDVVGRFIEIWMLSVQLPSMFFKANHARCSLVFYIWWRHPFVSLPGSAQFS